MYIPKDDPEKPRGQDDHFILPKLQALGVADGVGGWSKKGIDSGEYSRELMKNTVKYIEQQSQVGPVDPKRALHQAFAIAKAKGSSTACILALHNDCLHAVNVGDSGFVHIRNGRIIYRSRIQQHEFNCPYQLGKERNDLDVAEEIKRDVVPGDIIVAGTDGLFDNVHNEELEQLVTEGEKNFDSSEILACKIADFALQQAESSLAVTPFAVESEKAGNIGWIGGKNDDITVIVARVFPAQWV
ncbi:probable protein phosphatase 2C 55 [Coffea arabica]|uniref:Protein phosphatase n=1 Tax=Coffea arabica TaxID=13443 RepID=A0A6P6VLN9_COFAR